MACIIASIVSMSWSIEGSCWLCMASSSAMSCRRSWWWAVSCYSTCAELVLHHQLKLMDVTVQGGGDLAQRDPDLAKREDPQGRCTSLVVYKRCPTGERSAGCSNPISSK